MICSRNRVPGHSSIIHYTVPNPGNEYHDRKMPPRFGLYLRRFITFRQNNLQHFGLREDFINLIFSPTLFYARVICNKDQLTNPRDALHHGHGSKMCGHLTITTLIMAALCNRGPLYFCPVVSFYLLLLSFFLSSSNLSGHRLDVYHTSTHGVALVRI